MPWTLGTRRKLAAGQRDKAVVVEARVPQTDRGYPLEDWTPLGVAMMSRLDETGTERIGSTELQAAAITQWCCAYRPDLDPDLVNVPADRRLKFAGRIFDIQVATLMERRMGIELVTISSSTREGQ